MTSLLLVPALPLALAACLMAPALRPLAWAAMPLAPLAAILAALSAPVAADLPWIGLGARWETGGARSGFLLFTGVLWSLAALSALFNLRGDGDRTRFAALFLIAMAGNLGLIVAADAGSFYALFAMMSLASWGLVLHERSDFSRFAGRTYIAFAVAGELALFAGLALAAHAAGSTLLADLRGAAQPGLATALLLLGFGIKLGAVPLHLWLPLAHAAAPAPASAVLSGAMIKAGLFGAIVATPLGVLALPGFGLVLLACGGASIVLAALIGVTQSNPKAVLAYSSVGQMGLVAMALGIGFAAPGAWPVLLPALTLFAAHHAFAKAALFLGVPAVWSARGPAARTAVLALLTIPAIALAAAPWTSGAVAKAGLTGGFAGGPEAWYAWAYPLTVAGSVGTALLMVRFLVLMARAEAKPALSPLTALPWAAMTMLAAGGLWLLPFGAEAYGAAPLGDLIPVAAALALAALAALTVRLSGVGVAQVPPGEVLALLRPRPPAPLPTLPRPALPRLALPRRLPEPERGGLALAAVLAALIAVGVATFDAPAPPPPTEIVAPG